MINDGERKILASAFRPQYSARCRLARGEHPPLTARLAQADSTGRKVKLGGQMEHEQWRNMLKSYMIKAQKRYIGRLSLTAYCYTPCNYIE